METARLHGGRPLRAAKIDRATATDRPRAAQDDEGLVRAGVLQQLVRLDQAAADLGAVLRPPRARRGEPAPRPGLRAAIVTLRRCDNAVLAAHGGELLRGLRVLNGGEQAPGGRVVPGLLALASPLIDELPEGLV